MLFSPTPARLARAALACLVFAVGPAATEMPNAWLALAPFAAAADRPATSTAAAPEPWLVAATANWMARLPDARPLGALSIPGTHNSASRFGIYLCQNQTWSLADQLAAGARYLDIRLRPSGEGFAVHHSPCFQNIGFDGVMDIVDAFLSRHAAETVIMRVHEEYEPAPGSQPFRDIWARYMGKYGKRFLPALDRVPTLGEARGRVLALRDADFDGQGIAYGGPLLRIQDAWQVYAGMDDNPQGPDTVSVQQKYRLIRKWMAAAAARDPRDGALYLNHLSSPGLSGPMDFAAGANAYALRAIEADPSPRALGVVIMDYPGEGLVDAVVRTNFKR